MSDARRLNDGMGEYVAKRVIELMNLKGVLVKDAQILILGVTFKENCPDIRNTKVVDIVHTLEPYTKNITVYDPWANTEEVMHEYGLKVVNELQNQKFDTIVLAVAHHEFENLNIEQLLNPCHVVFDVKGFLPRTIIDGRL
jgi:UDP-N-acetyl-D-galactosamine dehydrogenase